MRGGWLLLPFLTAACGGGTPARPPAPAAAGAPAGHAAPAASDAQWPWLPLEPDEARVARLTKDPGPIKSNWTPPNRTERYGRAEGLVAASPGDVRARLLDFAHYAEIAGPKFSKVRVVDKNGGDTDVYFSLPIMRGLVRLWYVTRFRPPRVLGASEVFEGVFVKGNVKDTHIVFTLLRGADERSTIVTCDLLLVLSLPAPQASVDEELRDACGDAIHALRRRLVPAGAGAL